MRQLPLSGIRVLDLSRVLAGPLCTMLLGDLGADVIKVERPGRGDDTRGWGPPFDARGESAYFLSINRNKLSVTADLTNDADATLIRRLIAGADVVVDNFLPGALARLGLDADRLVEQNARLVWCTITGFGEESARPGYDFVVQAEAGWMSITGEANGDPMKSGIALADVLAGKDAAATILAGLVARQSGRKVERRLYVSLIESARAALINVAQNALVSGVDARRWGNAHANLVPYQLFRAADRPLVIAVGTDSQWRAALEVLQLDALLNDVALASNPGRVAQRDRIVAAFNEVLMRRNADEWIRLLNGAGVPCGLVRTVLEAIEDASGASAASGMPSAVGGTVRLQPPRLNEHGKLVHEHGWDAFRQLT